MSEIKNLEAYIRTMLRNWDKNEYRANDNFYKHISCVGDETDIQQEISSANSLQYHDTESMENQIGEQSVDDWLLFLSNERLHTAIRSLPAPEIEFLFQLDAFGFNQTAYAGANGVSRQSVCKRFQRIREKILGIL